MHPLTLAAAMPDDDIHSGDVTTTILPQLLQAVVWKSLLLAWDTPSSSETQRWLELSFDPG